MYSFQTLDWEVLDGDDELEPEFNIRVFGKSGNGESVCCTIKGYKPYFYIKPPPKDENGGDISPDTMNLDNFKSSLIHNKAWADKMKNKDDTPIDSYKEEHISSGGFEYELFEEVWKVPINGWNNNRKEKYFKIVFTDLKSFKREMNYFKKPRKYKDIHHAPFAFQLYESNVDPMLRFMHEQEITPAGIVKIVNVDDIQDIMVDEDERKSICDVELNVNYKCLVPGESDKPTPFIMASFDIECTSEDGTFPQAQRPGDKIIQIFTTFYKYGQDEPYYIHACVLGDTSPIDKVDMECFDNEKDLLMSWQKVIRRIQPDVLLGYNILGFDLQYLWGRAQYTKCVEDFRFLSKLRDFECELKTKTFTSNAYGHTESYHLDMPGILQIDLLQIIKREHKLESYKLDHVGEHFLKERKLDVTPREIFELFLKGPDERKRIAEYCLQDTKLPMRLMNKLTIFPNMIEMANVTRVPFEWLMSRGQQIKVFSQLVYECRKAGYLIPILPKMTTNDGYVGATVLHAKSGGYYQPITGLDFASLYPTIMIANNLCYTTRVRNQGDEIELDEPTDEDLETGFRTGMSIRDKKPVKVKKVEWTLPKETTVEEEDEETGKIIKKTTVMPVKERHYFVQSVDGEDCVGILPKILRNLLTERKKVKRLMASEKDPFKKAVLNGKQLALKVSCNSVYGFCGAAIGMMPCLEIASSVTTLGRGMIEKTKNLVEGRYKNADVVYGDTDSVMVKFDTGLEGKDAILKSFDIGEEAGEWVTVELNKDVHYKGVIDLEFEKVYCPYLLASKKRYAGLMHEKRAQVTGEKEPTIDIKGLQVVRRDNCHIVKDVCNGIIHELLIKQDIEAAKQIVRNVIDDLMNGKVQIDKLVLSKSMGNVKFITKDDGEIVIKSTYKNNNQPHIQVGLRMYKEDPGNAPRSGDRIPYVFVKHENENAKQFEKAADPKYVVENNIPIDVEYYLDHQIMNPVSDLMRIVMDDPENNLFGVAKRKQEKKDIKEAERKAIRDEKQRIKDQEKEEKKRLRDIEREKKRIEKEIEKERKRIEKETERKRIKIEKEAEKQKKKLKINN